MRILIVEDEPAIAVQLEQALAAQCYVTDRTGDGAKADFLVQTEGYDLVILDLGLPRVDGLTLLKRWRAAELAVPVLVLTARGSWHETVEGIDAGADDYVAKPFRMEEVLARVRALLRRSAGQAGHLLKAGEVALDARLARVTLKGAPVKLTSHEFRVLAYLMHHRDRLVPQGELAEHIYARDEERSSNTVEVFIARLRRKLGPAIVETVRGLGYRLGS